MKMIRNSIIVVILLMIVSCVKPSNDEIVYPYNGIANNTTISLINELDNMCWYWKVEKTSGDWSCHAKRDVGQIASKSVVADGSSINDVLGNVIKQLEE